MLMSSILHSRILWQNGMFCGVLLLLVITMGGQALQRPTTGRSQFARQIITTSALAHMEETCLQPFLPGAANSTFSSGGRCRTEAGANLTTTQMQSPSKADTNSAKLRRPRGFVPVGFARAVITTRQTTNTAHSSRFCLRRAFTPACLSTT